MLRPHSKSIENKGKERICSKPPKITTRNNNKCGKNLTSENPQPKQDLSRRQNYQKQKNVQQKSKLNKSIVSNRSQKPKELPKNNKINQSYRANKKPTQDLGIKIKEYMKKFKEKNMQQKMKNLEEEERLKRAKEQLNEQNEAIRKMNANNIIKSRLLSQESFGHKFAWGVDQQKIKAEQIRKEGGALTATPQKQAQSEQERRARLGLELVYKRKSVMKKGKENLGNNKKERQQIHIHINTEQHRCEDIHDNPKKEEIRAYITEKKGKEMNEKKSKIKAKEIKKAKISNNISRLEDYVQNIFGGQKQRPKSKPKKITKKTKKVKKIPKEEKSLFVFDKEFKSLSSPIEEDDQGAIMNIIRNHLREEIGFKTMNAVKEENLKRHRQAAERILNISCRLLNRNIKRAFESIKDFTAIVKRAITIQSLFRGYCKRKEFKMLRMQALENQKIAEVKTEEEKAHIEGLESQSQKEKVFICSTLIGNEEVKGDEDSKIIESSGADLMGTEKEIDDIDIKFSKVRNLRAKLINEIQRVEEQVQNSDDIEENKRQGLIKYLEKKEKEVIKRKNSINSGDLESDNIKHPSTSSNDISSIEDQKHKKRTYDGPKKPPKNNFTDSASGEENNPLLRSDDLPLKVDPIVINRNQKQIKSLNEKNVIPPIIQDQNDSLEMLIENDAQPRPSIFDKNSFHEFTLKKFNELGQTDNISEIIKVREKVLEFREKTERKYIQKMYNSKRYSLKTYNSKKKELEKWVTKEKVEIKKSKRRFIENWKKTAEMIEEAHKDAIRIKKAVFNNTLSAQSDTNSIVSLALNSSRPAIDFEDEIEKEEKCYPKTERKHEDLGKPKQEIALISDKKKGVIEDPANEEGFLNDSSEKDNMEVNDEVIIKNKLNDAVIAFPLKQEANLQESDIPKVTSKSKPECDQEKIEKNVGKDDLPPFVVAPAVILDEEIPPSKTEINNEQKANEITEILLQQLIAETVTINLPKRDSLIIFPEDTSKNSKEEMLRIQSLEYKKNKGIDTSGEYIRAYLEKSFDKIIAKDNAGFLQQINRPIPRSPLEVLHTLQNSEYETTKDNKYPIILPFTPSPPLKPQDDEDNFIEECQGIYNRALIASANEWLNLLRPYGLSGNYMPWSTNRRSTCQKVTDSSLIVESVEKAVKYY